jgi:ATP-binding cassette subfamily B protein
MRETIAMTNNITVRTIEAFLAATPPFQQLSEVTRKPLLRRIQLWRYRVGQLIVSRDKLPIYVAMVYEGQVRLLGYEPGTSTPVTLQRLGAGEMVGWAGLIRGVACETAIASTETICLTLPAADFLALCDQVPTVATYFHHHPALVEVFDLLAADLGRRADAARILQANDSQSLRDLALQLYPEAVVQTRSGSPGWGKRRLGEQPADRIWLISGGSQLVGLQVGDRATPETCLPSKGCLRLLGLPNQVETRSEPETTASILAPADIPAVAEQAISEIPYAAIEMPDLDPQVRPLAQAPPARYPQVRGTGPVNAPLACFQMLARYFGMPLRREVIRKVLVNQQQRTGAISLRTCGAVAELMGLRVQLVRVPLAAVERLPTPALVMWQQEIVVLYEASARKVVLGTPSVGIVRQRPPDLFPSQDEPPAASEQLEVLLVQPTSETPQQRFGLNWFWPSLVKYRSVLLEVLLASFFVQLFGLANPLITQVIIDKVLAQNSPDTLQVLGIFLVVIALFEALLTSLRTYLFVDTTNRIDLALGSEIIDHLLRLPLRYFEKRPVGDLATRVNELENIRQFLTSTALTVVLDAVFSVIYIVVMVVYSWLLTLVALATLPVFAALTLMVSPLIRQQLRAKAERNAAAQSHLVEVLSGIQTVKAQNIELRSRWQWQEHYARYISAGFRTVLTSTAASSTSNFLNKLSGLLVLWVGAYLVLQGQLSLGQLIAFRIIAGYVTSPLLRLTNLWQNFQQTALSLERLSDILDTPTETTALDRRNIPLPPIVGRVQYEQVAFRFQPVSPLVLNHVDLDLPAGSFVGVVGQSGSGKSTLMKLLPRLYQPESGRILVDGYDIHKVELYSLRQQIGIVPQDTLLFEGTVQDNIALNCPDASPEEIVQAAKVAVAHDFIMNLPNGYNTLVGERGSALSGGQRQRIAIARTILQNPGLLILDEATSALDYDSERQVSLNLADCFRGRTVFFITHRLSTIRNADVIVLMHQGAIVEQGTHAQLMALKGRYYCLYQHQDATQTGL